MQNELLLQAAKESIFTGTNNFVSDTISDSRLDEYFGFTQTDVDRLLLDTKLTSHRDEMKDWYNGYRFGGQDVYCPWDVVNHVKNLLLNPAARPEEIPETPDGGSFALTIPNAEIRNLFRKSVNEWFLAKTEASDRSALFDALWKGDAKGLQEYINDALFDT